MLANKPALGDAALPTLGDACHRRNPALSVYHARQGALHAIFCRELCKAQRTRRGNERFMGRLSELGELLHEEHFRIVMWLSDLKINPIATLGPDRGRQSPQGEMRELHRLLAALDAFGQHDAFEEEALFPLLTSRCGSVTLDYLQREHATIDPIVERLRSLIVRRLRRRHEPGLCSQLFQAANDLYGELIEHLAREEEVVIQRLRSLLDPETDRRLARQHVARPLSFGRGVG